MAQRGAVQHMQHGGCWQVLMPVGHEQLHHGPLGPGRLARRHVLDQLGERHPVGRRGERVRLLAHEVAVHEVLGAELLERGAPLYPPSHRSRKWSRA
jgi:hypothetical protein